ncbi:polysaccharide biosynthesis tyrosine autokinase [Flaviflexus ciconiae]|uniref:non-specific protein-tyrosine kinase n=1 Tax=Flaviflexus ciconiae TaxID=2496867 RepID=A0A3S9PWP4_9ACTO|nr:polysaccharide biosynthesis tyrosine autokinase [Flaviflexus ciconiae]AZQ76758.1 polysaccharide biosynthesis tyrosine autokinase [Flaviflexus ciconiae]
MELQQYLKVFRDYWRSILATLFVVVMAAAGYTLMQAPTYTATATVFVTVESGDSAGELSQGASYAERQVQSFVQVVETAAVLDPVIDEFSLDTTSRSLAGQISASSPNATSLIDITANGGNATETADLANAVAASLVVTVDDLAPTSSNGQGLVSASVIDPATVPNTPSAPKPTTNIALGIILGLLIGLGQALLRSVLDTRVRNSDDIESVTDKPILATVGHISKNQDASEKRAHSEAYRRLRTNISFMGLGGERSTSFVISSSVPGEGKTQTSVSLARVLAQAGETVLLIDADLRRPQVANRMQLDSELGLTDVLTRRGTLADLAIPASTNLWVLPAGTIPPNPSELLGSEAMAKLLNLVEREFDYVIIDTPPVIPVTDAVILASQTGGIVLVTRSGITRRAQFGESIEILDAGNATVLGVVLNDVNLRSKSDRYGYYSEYTTEESPEALSARPSSQPKHQDIGV